MTVAGPAGSATDTVTCTSGSRWAVRAPFLAALLMTASIGVQLRLAFYSWNDDLIQFEVAQQFGWGTELVTFNLFQHFAPVNRTLHWFAITAFGLDPALSVFISIALVLAFLLVVAWVAAELRLTAVRRTIAVLLVGGPIVLANTMVWMDGGWHGSTALIATYVVVALHLRGMRTGRPLWHLLSVLAFCAGLLTQERAAFALPLTVLADLLLVDQNRTWRERFRAPRAAWAAWTAMAIASILLAVVLRMNYVQPTAAGFPGAAVAAQTALAAFTTQLFPQVVGVVPELWPTAVQLVVLGGIGAIATALYRLDRRNTGPMLFLLLAFGLYWGFLVFSPNLTEANWIDQAKLHSIYTLAPVALAVSSLRVEPLSPSPTVRSARRKWAALSAIALLLLGSQWRYTSSSAWTQYRAAHDYLHAVVNDAAIWTDPAVTIIPTQAPPSVASDWALPLGRGESLLRMAAPGWQPGDLTGTVVAFDDSGNLHHIGLRTTSAAVPANPPLYPDDTTTSNGASCLSATSTADGLRFRIDPPIRGATSMIRMTYTSSEAGDLTPITLDGTDPNWSPWSYQVRIGTHTVLLPVDPGALAEADGYQLAHLPAGSTFCAASVEVVTPVVLDPGGTCRWMDAWGRPGDTTPCPAP